MNSITHPKPHSVSAKLQPLARRPFVRNVIALTTGSAAAQAVTLLLTPRVACQYVPAGFLNRPSVAAIATVGMQGSSSGHEMVSLLLGAVVVWIACAGFHNEVAALTAFCLAGALLNAFLVAATLVACGKARPLPTHDAASLIQTGASGQPNAQQAIS